MMCELFRSRIAEMVRNATIEDAYWPMSLAEFQHRFRPEGWTR